MGAFETLVLVGGLSGGGKTTAIHTLSDLGFYIVDNLPVALFDSFVATAAASPGKYKNTALLMDIESRKQLDELLARLAKRDVHPVRPHLLFLDCATEKIVARYSETRRPHPRFEPTRDATLSDAIERERRRLMPFREIANCIIDTTSLSIHDLKREIRAFVDTLGTLGGKMMRINFLSFGFKYGLPIDCDLVMDVRFLPNPHHNAELRPLTGKDSKIADFVLGRPETAQFIDKYTDLLSFLIPRYISEGKAYLNVGIGCTGGKHRSVVLAETFTKRVQVSNCVVGAQHRDLGKE